MNACIVKSMIRLLCGSLLFGLLTGMTGCTKTLHETKHEEVSGKVLFKAKPLPGGRVTFAAIVGGFASSAPIDGDGNYKINAPIGEVLISVDNRMFQPRRGARPGQGQRLLKRPDSQVVEAEPSTGRRYVMIPDRYANCDTSGLTYTVKPGVQTHDIELSDQPVPTPGPAGG